jgi:hypothetical protein
MCKLSPVSGWLERLVRLLDAAYDTPPKKLLLFAEITHKLHQRMAFMSSVIQNHDVIPDIDMERIGTDRRMRRVRDKGKMPPSLVSTDP